MSEILVPYFKLALCLSFAATAGILIWFLVRKYPALLNSKFLLILNWFLFIAAVGSSLLPSYQAPAFKFEAPVKIWAAGSAREHDKGADAVLAPQLSENTHVSLNHSTLGLVTLVSTLLGLYLYKIFQLYRLKRSSICVRSIKRVQILVSSKCSSPLSYYLPGHAVIIIPNWLIEKPRELNIAIRHELQHHRAYDTISAHVLTLMTVLFFWNPLLKYWERTFQEFQEIACDEALIGRQRISTQDYTSCLLKVAQRSLLRPHYLAGTPGFAWAISKGHLKRRLLQMRNIKMFGISKNQRRWAQAAIVTFALTTLSIGSVAAQNFLEDFRITQVEAKAMLDNATKDSEFPVVLNDKVLEQLNRYLGTPDGKQFFRDAVERMETLRPMLEQKTDQYNTPWELMAIPIVESGYKNPRPEVNPYRAAGAWQFIKSTAILYGLIVNEKVDERRDYTKSTDAALRYLLASKLRFQDWHLAILAYNVGEGRVQEGIVKLKTRDAFKLIENGYEGDRNYLAKVMAAVLILKNPSVLE